MEKDRILSYFLEHKIREMYRNAEIYTDVLQFIKKHENVWLCQNDADGNGALMIRFDKRDKDKSGVSDDSFSNSATSSFEVKC